MVRAGRVRGVGGARRYRRRRRLTAPHRSLDDGLGQHIWEVRAVNAEPAAQRRLLDLAEVDAELARTLHRRRSLPELAELEQAEQELRAGRDSLIAAETAASDL